MNTDLPLINTEDDQLGRLSFASEIATGLVKSFNDNSESIVLGINGSWGAGKSTLINFIISEVERISKEDGQEVIVIHFNPWMFSGQKELQNIFLKEMFLKLEKNKSKFKDASQKIADFLGHLNWLKYVHTGAGEAIEDGKKFLEGLAKEKDLNTLKKEIDTLLIDSKVKLYITIDDIDRLTPNEITDIFQLVKLNGNFANTIFILAYDQQVVVSALEKQFGENGIKYIEKIVQVDYTLPNISKENISRIFLDSLSDLFTDKNIQESILSSLQEIKGSYFIQYFKTLRDIYRYTNSIKLRLASIYNELNLQEYLSIEALRIFNYKAYEFIIKNKELLVFTKEDTTFGVKQKKTNISEIILNAGFDEVTISIINELFIHNDFFTRADPGDLIRKKKVANRNYFDRYFNLQLGDNDIPEKFFSVFLHEESNSSKMDVLHQIATEKNLFGFLHWAEIKASKLNEIDIRRILVASLTYLNTVPYKRESIWAWDTDYMIITRFSSKILQRIANAEKTQDLILEILKYFDSDNYALFFLTNSILNAKEQFEEGKLTSQHIWYALFPYEYPIDKCSDFLTSVKKMHEKSSLCIFKKETANNYLNDDELSEILQVVERYSVRLYDDKFAKLIMDDNYLIRLIWMSMKRAYMSSGDQFGYQLASYQFFRGLDSENVKNRFALLNLDEIEGDEKTIVQIFFKAYGDGFKEGVYYDVKTLSTMTRD